MGKYQKNIEAARRISVMQYLETYHPGELVRKTDKEYCTKTHSSLVITPANGLFHWFSQSKGGNNALDYLVKVEGMDFVSAVRLLNEMTPMPVSVQTVKAAPVQQQTSRPFVLPPADRNTEAATAYLSCFYHVVTRGKTKGMLSGFPLSGRCTIQRDCKLPPIKAYQKALPPDTVQYIGIAADEPKRLARLKPGQISLLDKYHVAEPEARSMCAAEGLLSPLYDFTKRGGCWFCPNASISELRHLYRYHPELWQLLLELQDVPNKPTERFSWRRTFREIDERFRQEGEQLSFYEER